MSGRIVFSLYNESMKLMKSFSNMVKGSSGDDEGGRILDQLKLEGERRWK